MMTFDQALEAIREAEEVTKRADMVRRQIAQLLIGHLRTSGVPGYVLAALTPSFRARR